MKKTKHIETLRSERSQQPGGGDPVGTPDPRMTNQNTATQITTTQTTTSQSKDNQQLDRRPKDSPNKDKASGEAGVGFEAAEPPVGAGTPATPDYSSIDIGRAKTRRAEAAHPAADEPEQTYAIGALADEFGITTRTIRFYESRHLISPSRRGTQRYYTRRDRARLIIILRAKNLGFSLEDVAAYLDLYDADPTQQAQTRLLLQKVEMSIASLQKKRADLDRSLRDLKDLRARCVDHLDKVRTGG